MALEGSTGQTVCVGEGVRWINRSTWRKQTLLWDWHHLL